MAAFADDSTPPETLANGRLVLGERLGAGSASSVYAAVDRAAPDTPLAVKLLSPNKVPDTALLKRFLREAKALSTLRHPHVIRVYETGHDGDQVWMSMDLKHESCHQLAYRTRGVPPEQCLAIAEDVLKGLAAVHAEGWVHRDIKPGNVLLATDGCACIADFGIVRTEASTLTGMRASLGTQRYMPPEQRIDSRAVTPRTDLYSLGASLIAMSLAAMPRDMTAALAQKSFRDKLSPLLRPIVVRACQPRPFERYKSAYAMLAVVRRQRASIP